MYARHRYAHDHFIWLWLLLIGSWGFLQTNHLKPMTCRPILKRQRKTITDIHFSSLLRCNFPTSYTQFCDIRWMEQTAMTSVLIFAGSILIDKLWVNYYLLLFRTYLPVGSSSKSIGTLYSCSVSKWSLYLREWPYWDLCHIRWVLREVRNCQWKLCCIIWSLLSRFVFLGSICCKFNLIFAVAESTCVSSGASITYNNTYLRNPSYPSAYPTSTSATTCAYKINKLSDNICQVRLDFQTLELGQTASSGACTDMIQATLSAESSVT